MRSIPAHRPSPATVISMIALFVALAGTAWASVGANSVNSNKVKNNTLKSVDVKNNNLTGTDVAGNSLKGGDIDESTLSGLSATPSGSAGGDLTGTYPNPLVGTNAIGSAEVAADSLLAGDLAPDSVGTSEVAANSLAAGDLAPDSVGASEIVAGAVQSDELNEAHIHQSVSTAIAAGTDNNGFINDASATATCAAGEDLIGWSIDWLTAGNGEEVFIVDVAPNFATDSVVVIGGSDEATTENFQAEAWCIA